MSVMEQLHEQTQRAEAAEDEAATLAGPIQELKADHEALADTVHGLLGRVLMLESLVDVLDRFRRVSGWELCKPGDEGAMAVEPDGAIRPAHAVLSSPDTVWMRRMPLKPYGCNELQP